MEGSVCAWEGFSARIIYKKQTYGDPYVGEITEIPEFFQHGGRIPTQTRKTYGLWTSTGA